MIVNHTMQQGTLEWLNMRHGKITGTTLGDVVKAGRGDKPPATRNTLMLKCLADLMAERINDNIVNAAMEHGNQTEDMARKQAIETLGINFTETGFLENTDLPGFGFSPDAVFVEPDGKIVGGLEIKCPNSEKHIEYILDGEIPKAYYHQVLAPFVLSDDVQWWYFMSFDYRNYTRPEFYYKVQRADFGEDLIYECREKIREFHSELKQKEIELSLG